MQGLYDDSQVLKHWPQSDCDVGLRRMPVGQVETPARFAARHLDSGRRRHHPLRGPATQLHMRLVRPRGIRAQLVLLVLCAVLPGFLLAVYIAADTRRRESMEAQQSAYRLARLSAIAQERSLQARLESLLVFGSRAVAMGDLLDCGRRSGPLAGDVPGFVSVGIAGPLAGPGCDARGGIPHPRADWIDHTLERGAAVSGYQSNVGNGRAGIMVGVRIGTALGPLVLYGVVDPAVLLDEATVSSLPQSASVTLLDRAGVILARKPTSREWRGRNVADRLVVRTALQQGDGHVEAPGIDEVTRLFGFHRLHVAGDSPLLLLVGIPKEVAFAGANRHLAQSLAFLCVMAAVSVGFTWLASERLIMRPVRRLVRAVADMSGESASQTAVPADELGQLSSAFDAMAAALRRHEAEVQQAAEALRALAARIESAREAERTSIAREIHDQLGQNLTALRMDVDWISRALSEGDGPSPLVGRKLQGMMNLLDHTVPLVRNISRRLRPGVLDALGLPAAIEWQLEEFSDRTGIRTHFVCGLDHARLRDEEATTLFRILQEALTNIIRHAGATSVTVHLNAEGASAILEISDDGVGITPEALDDRSALGLLGMRERAQAPGGRLEIEGKPGRGTTVSVWVPLAD